MPRIAAGLLMYRVRGTSLQVLLAHPGGPFWKNKDDGHWTIPKGEIDAGEDLLAAARCEFEEEVGFAATGEFLPLGSIQQKGGKIVHAWAVQGDCDTAQCRSNTIEIEWPPRSGKKMTIPEVDRVEFFDIFIARRKIKPAQVPLLEALARAIQT